MCEAGAAAAGKVIKRAETPLVCVAGGGLTWWVGGSCSWAAS